MHTELNLFAKEKEYYLNNEEQILSQCDDACVPALRAINQCSYLSTLYCCEGHDDKGKMYYIQMVYGEESFNQLFRLYQILTDTYPGPNVVEVKFGRKRTELDLSLTFHVVTFFVRRGIYTKATAKEVSDLFIHWINLYRSAEPDHFEGDLNHGIN